MGVNRKMDMPRFTPDGAYKINMGDHGCPLGYLVEAKKREPECKYVGYLAVKEATPARVFLCPQPRSGFTNRYFGIYVNDWQGVVFNADAVAEGDWTGLLHIPSGEVIFSRYTHDFREFSFGGPAVDGGREYTRVVGSLTSDFQLVPLRCKEGRFQVVD
jgi:hypothetical protein